MNHLAKMDFDLIQNKVSTGVGGAGFLKFKTFGELISILLDYIFAAAGIALLLYLIMGGIQYMTSGGDPKATQAAKQKITNAIIGVIIIFASFWIVQIVGSILGIDMFTSLFS